MQVKTREAVSRLSHRRTGIEPEIAIVSSLYNLPAPSCYRSNAGFLFLDQL